MPRITISLSSEILNILTRDGKPPGEKIKEIVMLQAERIARIDERASTIDSILEEVLRYLQSYIQSQRTEDLLTALRLTKIAISLIQPLPLSEGEKKILEIFDKILKSFEEMLIKYTNTLVQANITTVVASATATAATIVLISTYIIGLLWDVRKEIIDFHETTSKLLNLLNMLWPR
jgi:predicted DNA-binding antitoxin AbrB/MazE fold protein